MPQKDPISTPNQLDFPLPDLKLIKVEPGSFMMGDDNGHDDEKPAHRVEIPYSFYIGIFQVTQQLYTKVTKKENPSRFIEKRRPVEKVSWEDTKDFLRELEDLKEVKDFKEGHQLTNYKFRLPSEAEWEYAARGGHKTQKNKKRDYYKYSGSDDLKQVGWYADNSGGETKPVGLLLPNELGVYDMSGNVFEWCEDDWHNDYNSPNRPDDGKAWVDGSIPEDRADDRVIRGGDYFGGAGGCRPAIRNFLSPDNRYSNIGFRVVLAPVQ